MEPSDFDKIIYEKLGESTNLHQYEKEAAKPFVWSAIQQEVSPKRTFNWYYPAAAIVVLLITFSIVIISIHNDHKKEIMGLSEKVERLEQKYSSQTEALYAKNTIIDTLGKRLSNVESKFTRLQQYPQQQKPKIVYQTDTVYLKPQYKHIMNVENTNPSEEEVIDAIKNEPIFVGRSNEKVRDNDYAIYSNAFDQREAQQPESFKLKFGSFATRNN